MANTVAVETPRCIHCGNTGILWLDEQAVYAYSTGTVLVQNAFPDVSRDAREQIISGTHPHCWVAIFGNGEEE